MEKYSAAVHKGFRASMRLGIVSDCTHFRNENGTVGTENHILLRQFEALAEYFEQTTICCPFEKLTDKKVASYYSKPFNFIELPSVGGDSFKDKLNVISAFPKWFRGFREIDKAADIIYQRFPNNVNIPGFYYFKWKKKNTFATYTGTWEDYQGEPATYRFQKQILKNNFRGPVWVYTLGATGSSRILAGISPSYSVDQWNEETEQVEIKKKAIASGLPTLNLISVGKLIEYKNQITILKSAAILKEQGIAFNLLLVGEGPDWQKLEEFVAKNGLSKMVHFTGKKNLEELRQLYRQSDFVVQAPLKEGFGKVPVEGFFHGVIPILSNVSLASHMTGNGKRGFLFDPLKPEELAQTLISIKDRIAMLPGMIDEGRKFAKTQTLEQWASDYYDKVSEFFKGRADDRTPRH